MTFRPSGGHFGLLGWPRGLLRPRRGLKRASGGFRGALEGLRGAKKVVSGDLEDFQGRKKVVQNCLRSSWSSEATLFQPKGPPRDPPRSPQEGSEMGLKLKTWESRKSLISIRKPHILAPERGPKWVPNRPRIASKMREGAESFKNRVQDCSERAPRAKKSSIWQS